ncbi:MAG: isoleucine--tRNA ligase, partial [Chitinophagia bacterium]|nr:isoleucine--tRNA ligase [Chitinophagia bacterium]
MSINDSAIERQKFLEGKGFNMSAIEQGVLAQWDAIDCFEQSLSLRADAPTFVFYEGPPSANGKPGIHHVISRTLKDLVCRYKTMQGFLVNRKAGWDTHGLPIELGVEKELGITKEDIGKKISVEDYNKKCREAVMRFKDKWEDITRKMGYWVDMEHPYITFENEYIQSLWWALKTLYGKDYLYKSVSIQPYSPAAGTGLSSHELNQPGTYKNVKDTTIVAIFKAIANEQSEWLFKHSAGEAIHFLAWTTTPWTLPSNCGLTVGANIEYVLVHTVNPYLHTPVYVVLAEKLLGKYFKPEGENGDIAGYSKENKVLPYTILASFKGSELENIRYEQLIPLPANTAVATGGDPWRVVLGDFVTTEDGTGIVHTAPAFGADDFKVGKKNNLGILILVDKEGKFIDGCNELSGRYIKNYKDGAGYTEPDIDIAVALKNGGKAFKVEKYEHTYPHCWRTDKPVVYYPLDAWFIRTTAVKDRMIELNKTINWKPKSTGEGRFGNWLEN